MIVNIHWRALSYCIKVAQLIFFKWIFSTPSINDLISPWTRWVFFPNRFIKVWFWFILLQCLLLFWHLRESHKSIIINRTWIVSTHVSFRVLTGFQRLMRSKLPIFFIFGNPCSNHIWARTWSFIAIKLTWINKVSLLTNNGFEFVLLFWPWHR